MDQIKLKFPQEELQRIADGMNAVIKTNKDGGFIDTNLISDGYHTFGELYEHRIALWITVCRLQNDLKFRGVIVWKSKFHSDGSTYEGWFLLGMILPDGKQLSYHLPNEKWEECNFATTLSKAPEWDGHTSADVLQRLKEL